MTNVVRLRLSTLLIAISALLAASSVHSATVTGESAAAGDAKTEPDCAGLLTAKFADTEITKAERVTGGDLTVSNYAVAPAVLKHLPSFCRVVGVIRPTADSEIGFELWLPDHWNGRYLQAGNGGFAGSIWYGELAEGTKNGFAVANTDDGHVGALWDATWALGQHEKGVDFGYRAVHLTSVTAKHITRVYYGKDSARAYMTGCSGGGREALMEVQRFPEDFDGWVVGAPASNWTGFMTSFLHIAQIVSAMKEPFEPSQLQALTRAALRGCEARSVPHDGVIENPLECRFDPATLLCKGPYDGHCLMPSQVEAARGLYDDARDARTGASLAPGLQGSRGTENSQWPLVVTGPVAAPGTLSQIFSENFWAYLVYQDPRLDYKKLDLLQAAIDARSRVGEFLNAMDPDLSTARASGKKIIQYHGWADAIIPAQYSIAYYESVSTYLRRDNRDFYRLFMAPGMTHCAGGPGPNVFGGALNPGSLFDPEHDVLAALVRWVEQGKAPDQIIATKFQDDDPDKPVIRTRPLCVYPKVAHWLGTGSADDAKNFACIEPPQAKGETRANSAE